MNISLILKSTFISALLIAGFSSSNRLPANAASGPEASSSLELKNVALGKKVLFSPAPARYKAGNAGLTDGKLITGENLDLYGRTDTASWHFPGKVNIAVDLGKLHHIDEIAIRLQNGSRDNIANSGRLFPGWVEAFVSDDGENYIKVAEFSQWNKGEFEKFNISQNRGAFEIDVLRFKDLKAQGRWVGLRIYGASKSASDEVYVFGTPATEKSAPEKVGQKSGFTVTHPQVYFHKPYLEVANNIPLPVPIGVSLPAKMSDSNVDLEIDVPEGLDILAGSVGKVDVNSLKPEQLSNGKKRFTFSAKDVKHSKKYGNLYLQATTWKDGQSADLQYRFSDGKWQSPELSIPVRAVHVPDAPRLKSIMTSMGWSWDIPSGWPDVLSVFKTIGLNTINVMGEYGVSKKVSAAVDEARKSGFFISAIDSPLAALVKDVRQNHPDRREIFDQFANGKDSNKFCISYRGKYYHQEVQRVADTIAKVNPDFASMDIEPWGNEGPVHSRNCLRCQADFKESGLGSWEEWQQVKGKEIINDLIAATQKSLKKVGGKTPKIGSYNFSFEHVYQGGVFNFDDFYPNVLNTSQSSIYTNLQPADLIYIGDKVRNARQKMEHSNVMPWLTPGDAGSFPGSAFQWSLLEAYTNGSSGVWFWSNRVWDSEDLIAYNKVIRAIAPVEEVIIDGELVGDSATVQGTGRVSGMRLGSRMVLLVADYFQENGDLVKLSLNLSTKSKVRDLFTGEVITDTPGAGSQHLTVPLNRGQARLIEVTPIE